MPRGYTAQGSCWVEQERDNTSRGSNNGDTTGRKRRQQHRLRAVRSRAHPEEVTPEKGKCNRAVQARDTLAFKQQMFNVAPSVFPSRLSPRSGTKIRTQGEDVIVAETTRRGNSCDPKVKTMIPNKVGRAQGLHFSVMTFLKRVLGLIMHRRCCLQHFLLIIPLLWLPRLGSSRSSSTLLLHWDVPPLGA